MKWRKTLDFQTIHDGYGTLSYFMKPVPFTEEEFTKMAKKAPIVDLSVAEYKALKAKNAGYNRLGKKSAEEAYPEHDRERGDKDVASVNMLLTTKKSISPVLLIRIGKKELIKLDGVHRTVAASITKSKIRLCIINI